MKSNQIANSAKFAFSLALVSVVLLCGILISLQWSIEPSGATWLTAMNKTIAEMLLVIAASLLLFSVWWPIRLLSAVLFSAYGFVVVAQLNSIQFSSTYLPPVALENAKHVDFLLDTTKLGWLVILFIALGVAGAYIHRAVRPIPKLGSRMIVAFVLVICAVLVKNDSRWLSEEAQKSRFDFYNSGRAVVKYKGPGSAMLETLKLHQEATLYQDRIDAASKELPMASIDFAIEHGISLNEIDSNYPLAKNLSHESPPSFLAGSSTADSSEDNSDLTKNNVIVFFVEGMSSRIIQPYTDIFPEISPNFESFSEISLVVDDYYNHSYATYRGLSGQFCSIYANGRLFPETDYYCLPHALDENGYETLFFVSQSLEKTDLDEVAKLAGFNRVFGSKELAPLIPDDPEMDFTIKDFILYDTSFIESFKRWMKQREADDQTPFFAALYNFQTHTGVRLNSDVKYNDPTGKNHSYVLDTFHNFDQAFGNFWNYFKESPYFDNTIVIVTSDHSTFGSKDYAKLVRDTPGYVQIFADKIPLMVYHPQGKPGHFSARNASSVNFAPSVLHILDIEAESVPFFGNSIFDETNIYPNPLVASSGISYFNVAGRHWLRQVRETKTDIPPSVTQAKPFHDLILFTQGLERQNRLSPSRN